MGRAHYGLYRPDRQTLFEAEELPLARAMRGTPDVDHELYIRSAQVPRVAGSA